jgi:hypothetical protein
LLIPSIRIFQRLNNTRFMFKGDTATGTSFQQPSMKSPDI